MLHDDSQKIVASIIVCTFSLGITPEAFASPAGFSTASTFYAVHSSRPPNYVAGYTDHALERMRKRNVSRQEVEDVVADPKNYSWQKRKRTWRLNDRKGRLYVIINENAYIVTIVVVKKASGI